MAWAIRKPDKVTVYMVVNDWRDLLDLVRLKSENKHAMETYIKFTDGSHIRHVYGNLYVAFDGRDKQICVKSCESVEIEPHQPGDTMDRPWFDAEDEIPYPPDCDHNLEKFEFTGGWADDLSQLENSTGG